MEALVKFLTNTTIDQDVLQCVYVNSEGSFHRKPGITDFDPFAQLQNSTLKDISSTEKLISNLTQSCIKAEKCSVVPSKH